MHGVVVYIVYIILYCSITIISYNINKSQLYIVVVETAVISKLNCQQYITKQSYHAQKYVYAQILVHNTCIPIYQKFHEIVKTFSM